MVSKALRFTLYRRLPWNSIFRSNSLYTPLPSRVMGINGWSFPSVAARRNAYTDRLIIRPARGIFQSFFPNFGFSESCTNLRRKFSLPGKCPGSPHTGGTGPSEEILYLHHFGTALRGGKGSCRADLSTGRLRHSCHSALPSRTWWNVFLIGNAKISGHPPLPRSYIFPLFLQILLPGRKCVIWR